MKKTVGVSITYYNEKELLRECIDSLLRGEVAPDEILVYDDASQFPAVDYIPDSPLIRVVRGEENVGPSRGRNRLLRESYCHYIHFHDSDDLFASNWCRRVKETIEETAASVVFTEISSYDFESEQLIAERVLNLQRLNQERDLVRFCIQGSMLVPSGTYDRTLVLKIGGYPEELWQSEDFGFHMRLALSKASYVALDEPLIYIRIRSESRSQNTAEVWSCAIQAMKWILPELPHQYHAELAEAAARAGSTLFENRARRASFEAFEFARKIGPPQYLHKNRFYRLLASTLGPLRAERVGVLYRRALPEGIRRFCRKAKSAVYDS